MYRVSKVVVFVGALTMINVGIAFGAHGDFFQDQNANLCFEETVKVKNGADPESLSTIYCKRALRVEPLGRENRSAILFNRGIIQKAQGDLAAARASFRHAVRLSTTVDRRNLALAEIARELGDYRVALDQYDLLIESGFAFDSEDIWVALLARREETLHSFEHSLHASVATPDVTNPR
jgi:tetratricopeptide (TPR) repeat protein